MQYLIDDPKEIAFIVTKWSLEQFSLSLPSLYEKLEGFVDRAHNYVKLQMSARTPGSPIVTLNWKGWFDRLGAITLRILAKKGVLDRKTNPQCLYEFANFLFSKHKAYGAAPLLRWRGFGMALRIDSKLARIKNLMALGEEEQAAYEESIVDNLKDILGYCILGILLEDKVVKHEKNI